MNFLKEIRNPNLNSVLFAFFTALNQFIPFLLAPILIRYLNPDEFGLLSMYGIIFDCFLVFIGLSSGTLIYSQYSKNSENQNIKLLNKLNSFSLFNLILVLLFIFIFKNSISELTKIESGIYFWASINAFLSIVVSSYYQHLQLTKRTVKYFLILIFSTLINFSFSIYLVSNDFGYDGRILGIFIASSAIYIYVIISDFEFKKNINIYLRFSLIREVFKESISFLPFNLFTWLGKNIDKLLIFNFFGLKTLAIYAVAQKIVSIFSKIIAIFIQGYRPFIYSALKDNDSISLKKFYKAIILVVFLVIIGYICLLPLFKMYYTTEAYSSLYDYLPFLFLKAIFDGLMMLPKSILIYFNKSKTLSIISSSTVGVSSILMSISAFNLEFLNLIYISVITSLSLLLLYTYKIKTINGII